MRNFWRDFLRDGGDVIVIAVVVLSIFAICIFGSIAAEMIVHKNACNNMQALTPDREFSWNFWSGCLVKLDSGYWVDPTDLKYLEAEIK